MLHEDRSARLAVAREASGQIESLIRMLGRELKNDEDPDAFEDTLICSMRRMLELNSVVLSVVGGDDLRATEELNAVVSPVS